MPTLSNYWFKDTDFRGDTTFLSIQHPAGGWAWINWSNIGDKHSTLTWEREDSEVTYDLVSLLNTPLVLNLIDSNLGEAQRTSDLRVGWVPRKYLPYASSGGALDLFLRLSFNFHISTPWYCSDADGHIDYIIACYLDSAGHVGAYVDGWAYQYNGGGPFCTGEISSRLSSAVPGAIGTLQQQLNLFLELLGRRQFDMLYYLPGSAERSGSGTTNVNDRVSLALLPR
ncbi:MAG TPA: hypothetical protein VFX43_11465 [Chitinophagaceae bacterium]|nr:hypothetical protein [Chitinophagaceae bacterium]